MIQDIQDFFDNLSTTEQEELKQLLSSTTLDQPPKNATHLFTSTTLAKESIWRYLHFKAHIEQFSYPLGEKSLTFIQQLHQKELGEHYPQFPYLMTSMTSMLVRYLAILSIQAYIALTNGNNASINVSIIQTIRSPTDNQWWALCRTIVSGSWLKSIKESSPCKDLLVLLQNIMRTSGHFTANELKQFSHPSKSLQKVESLFGLLLQYRNALIHAEPITEADTMENAYVLLRVLQSLIPISEYKLCCELNNIQYQFTGKYPQIIAYNPLHLSPKELSICFQNNVILTLSPLLSLAQNINDIDENDDIFFINAGSLRHLSYVGFIKGQHKDGNNLGSYEQFKKYLASIPVPAGAIDNPRLNFDEFVSDKTKFFVGRENVLTEINDHITNSGGHYILLKALPGMGKSAIMAHLYNLFHQAYVPNQTESGDIWLYHFCMHTEGRDVALTAFRSLLTQLEQALGTYSKKRKASMDLKEVTENFQTLLNSSSSQSKLEKRQGNRIVVLIDALDEAQLSSDDNIISSIPNYLAEHVVFLLSYRVNYEHTNHKVESLLKNLPTEKQIVLQTANPLNGLKRTDVKQFLQLANQNVPVNSSVEETVWQGASRDLQDFADPFFLRFIIDGVQKKQYSLNRAETIPSSLQQAFEQMWLGLSPDKDFLAHRLLVTLGIMRDLGDDALFVELFNRQFPEWSLTEDDIIETRRSIGKLLSYDGQRYGLFHDRFRYFLVGEQPDPIEEALKIMP